MTTGNPSQLIRGSPLGSYGQSLRDGHEMVEMHRKCGDQDHGKDQVTPNQPANLKTATCLFENYLAVESPEPSKEKFVAEKTLTRIN